VLCRGVVALIVVANLGCAPTYFQRGDVSALLVIGRVDAVMLLGASSGDSDTHRAVGIGASASAVALFLDGLDPRPRRAARDRRRVPPAAFPEAAADAVACDPRRGRRDRRTPVRQLRLRFGGPVPVPLSARGLLA